MRERLFYPRDYFIAKNYKTDEYCISKNTFAIHHYSGSWFTDEEKIIVCLKKIL